MSWPDKIMAQVFIEICVNGRRDRAEGFRRSGSPHVVYPVRDPDHDEAVAWMREHVTRGWRSYRSALGSEYAFADAFEAVAFKLRFG